MNFKETFPGLNSDLIDVAAHVALTDKRKKEFDFSKTYYEFQTSLVIDNDKNHICNLDSEIKNDLKFGVVIGSIFDDILTKFEPNIKLTRFDSFELIFEAFKSKLIDVLFNDQVIIDEFIKKNQLKNYKIIKIEKMAINGDEISFMFKKGNEKLQSQFNKAIDELAKEGKIEELKKKYNLE
jgi:ABC-type amino acid transport substrate-binding protein